MVKGGSHPTDSSSTEHFDPHHEVEMTVCILKQRLIPFIWALVQYQEIVLCHSWSKSLSFHLFMALSWWIGYAWLATLLLTISSVFVLPFRISPTGNKQLMDQLVVRRLLREDDEEVHLRGDWAILQWVLSNCLIMSRSLRSLLSGWQPLSLALMIFCCTSAVTMSFFGIVPVTSALMDGCFVICLSISALLTFVPPLRRLAIQSHIFQCVEHSLRFGLTEVPCQETDEEEEEGELQEVILDDQTPSEEAPSQSREPSHSRRSQEKASYTPKDILKQGPLFIVMPDEDIDLFSSPSTEASSSPPYDCVLLSDGRFLFTDPRGAQQTIQLNRSLQVRQPAGVQSPVFSLWLEKAATLNLRAESFQMAAQWVEALAFFTPLRESSLQPLLNEQEQRKHAKYYHFSMSPLPAHLSESEFPGSYSIEGPESIQELGPVMHSSLLVSTNNKPQKDRQEVYLYRTYLFRFDQDCPSHYWYLDVKEGAEIRVNRRQFQFIIASSNGKLQWTCEAHAEDVYLQWLCALSFVRHQMQNDLRFSTTSILPPGKFASFAVQWKDLKQPLHTGTLRLHSRTEESPDEAIQDLDMQEWHAVLHSSSIYLFLSTFANEWSSLRVNLINSWLEELPHYGDGEEYFFAIRQLEGTRECYLFAAPSESAFRAWSRVIDSVSSSLRKTSVIKEKTLMRVASEYQSPNQLRRRLNRSMSDSIIHSSPSSDVESNHPSSSEEEEETEEATKPTPQLAVSASSTFPAATSRGAILEATLLQKNSSDEELPSVFRIPQEEVEGVGLALASYQLLNPTKVGFLYKRGHVVKRWSRRYFVLKGHKMFYFRDITDRSCAGIILLRECVKPRLASYGSKFPYGISLYNIPNERDYVLAAGSFAERKAWYEAILGCMPERFWQSPHRLSQVNFEEEADSYRSTSSVHSLGTDSGWSGEKPRLEGHVLKLRKKQLISTWKPRFFVLRDGILKSFSSEKEEHPKTVWSADQLHAALAAPQGGQKHLFRLHAITGIKQVSYMIAVSTDAEAQQWVDAINDTKKEMEAEREQILRKWSQSEPAEPSRPRSNFLGATQRSSMNGQP